MTDPKGIEIDALDHVHLYVADLDQAAGWYTRILGLQVMPSSKSNSRYMATPKGQYCATLFLGQPPSDGDHTTAFRVPGRIFRDFGDRLAELQIPGRQNSPLTRTEAADHGLAWSYYFQDADGNHLEITTYDHQTTRAWFTKGARP